MIQPPYDPDPLTPPEPIESDWEHARRPGLSVGCARVAIMAGLAVFWIAVALLAIALATPRAALEVGPPGRASLGQLAAPHVPSGTQSAGVRGQSADDWYLVLRGYPSGAPSPAAASLRSQPVAGSSSPTSMPAPTRSGTWAYALPSHGSRYLAIPEGRGIRVTICGPLGCLSRVSTDAGPALYLQRAGRIGDLSSVDFVIICGPTSRGLCRGGWYTIEPRPSVTLPPTDGG